MNAAAPSISRDLSSFVGHRADGTASLEAALAVTSSMLLIVQLSVRQSAHIYKLLAELQ